MSDISLWEAMKRIERLNPRCEYFRPHSYGRLFFETKAADGVVSVLIENGYSSMGSSSPHSYDGFLLTITLDKTVIFQDRYNVEYRTGFFGGNPKPHYSPEYRYLKKYFAPYEERERAEREEETRKEDQNRCAKELEIQTKRNRFFDR